LGGIGWSEQHFVHHPILGIIQELQQKALRIRANSSAGKVAFLKIGAQRLPR
jgi:hypothetical protein